MSHSEIGVVVVAALFYTLLAIWANREDKKEEQERTNSLEALKRTKIPKRKPVSSTPVYVPPASRPSPALDTPSHPPLAPVVYEVVRDETPAPQSGAEPEEW